MKSAHSNLLELEVPGLAENRPSLLKGDKIIVQMSSEGSRGKKFEGIVHEVLEKSVRLGFSESLRKK